MTGPRYGAAEKIAMACPLSLLCQISDKDPPIKVIGAENAIPSIRRQIKSVSIFLAKAQGMINMSPNANVTV